MVKGGEDGFFLLRSHSLEVRRGEWQVADQGYASSGSLLDWTRDSGSWLVFCMLGLGMTSVTEQLQWAALDRF